MATFTSNCSDWSQIEAMQQAVEEYMASSAYIEFENWATAFLEDPTWSFQPVSSTTITGSNASGGTATITGSGFYGSTPVINRIVYSDPKMNCTLAGSVSISIHGISGAFTTGYFATDDGLYGSFTGRMPMDDSSWAISRETTSFPTAAGPVTLVRAFTLTPTGTGVTLRIPSLSMTDAQGHSYSITGSAYAFSGDGSSTPSYADILAGMLAGNDLLSGGPGPQALRGFAGDDTYLVDDAGDQVAEQADQGIDQVRSAIAYTLPDNVENLYLTGKDAIAGTGNTLPNLLAGNAAANTLGGGAGADTLMGGAGNDTYRVDDAGDRVSEASGAGIDLVETCLVSYALPANVERLSMQEGAMQGTGNGLANAITGNAAANTLEGGLGADTLAGGLGDDTYGVNSSLDRVVEAADAGADTVLAAVSWRLGENLEHLTLTGLGAIAATGNGLGNLLTGNAAANTVDGGAGADTLRGGNGSDTYVVDAAGDMVEETTAGPAGGLDRVRSSISFALGDNLEQLYLTGSAAIDGTGNGLANLIAGNSGDNCLDGGQGNDTLRGGLGNDILGVDSLQDSIVEYAGQGVDEVRATVNWTLGANLENLALAGSANLNGTGNSLANVLTGNDGANILNGKAGRDSLVGGAGADTLVIDRVATLTATLGDFDAAGGDRICLAGTAYAGLFENGILRAGVLGSGTTDVFSRDAPEQRLLYNAATGGLWFDRDGAAGSAIAVQIAGIATKPATLDAASFLAPEA